MEAGVVIDLKGNVILHSRSAGLLSSFVSMILMSPPQLLEKCCIYKRCLEELCSSSHLSSVITSGVKVLMKMRGTL